MTVVAIREPLTAEPAVFDALHGRQLMREDASILRKMTTVERVRANGRALRVLVVDGQLQDAVNTRVELARRLGFTVCRAFDGLAALRLAAVQHPDVVLIDIRITLDERCQIARHLRFDFPRRGVWIIAVTRRIDDERRNMCTDAGIDVLLAEPVDPGVFETLLILECMRVNRSEAEEAAASSVEGLIRVPSHDNCN